MNVCKARDLIKGKNLSSDLTSPSSTYTLRVETCSSLNDQQGNSYREKLNFSTPEEQQQFLPSWVLVQHSYISTKSLCAWRN